MSQRNQGRKRKCAFKENLEKSQQLPPPYDNPDISRCILSFLIAPFPTLVEGKGVGWEEENQHQENQKSAWKDNENISFVCTQFHAITNTLKNLQAPQEVLSPANLATIKSVAASLDFKPLEKAFTESIKEKWGGQHYISDEGENDMDDLTSPLQAIVQTFGGSYKQFARLVSNEYKVLSHPHTLTPVQYFHNLPFSPPPPFSASSL